jgi:hypothetical protein
MSATETLASVPQRKSIDVPGISAGALLVALVAAKLLIQFAGIGRYGFFRDELYYMACGQHLAWGYIDQPPLIALVAWLERQVLGDSIVSIRLLPILAGAVVVVITATMAREMGGGRFAQFLAGVTILFAPAYLAFDSFLSMNAFEPLLWLLCAWLVVRAVKENSQGETSRLWIAFGVVAGIGLENKHTMLVFGFSLAAGLLLGGEARTYRSKWIWIGAALAMLIFLPNLLWEARHGWPQIEVVRNAQQFKNEPISATRFLFEQMLFLDPLALPVVLGGLAWLFAARDAKRFRFLAWAYLITMAAIMIPHGKTYYALPVYPMLIAAGGVAFEQIPAAVGTWLRRAVPTLVVIGGLIGLPLAEPLLPVDALVRYSNLMSFTRVQTERDATVELSQLYADMFGWENLATQVAQVFHALPAEEQADCAILAGNYGEAGAIDYYGPRLGLPPSISGHNSYFDWGPRNYSGRCVILVGERSDEFVQYFGRVQRVATTSNPYGMPIERAVPIYVCRQPKIPLANLWPRFKMII